MNFEQTSSLGYLCGTGHMLLGRAVALPSGACYLAEEKQ